MTEPAARGQSAAELASAIAELQALIGATVLDAVALVGTDDNHDVLLVLRSAEDAPKSFLHVGLGGTRARVTTTSRRFGKHDHARGPGPDLLQRELAGARLTAIEEADGERRCAFLFDTAAGRRALQVELFGARGLWALCDELGVALTVSRPVETAVRTLRRGDVYAPPPPAPARLGRTEPLPRFSPPVLPAIDAHFTAIDLANEQQQTEGGLRLAAERALKRARAKVAGLEQKLADGDRAQQLRSTANLMLAYAHGVRRGADHMTVPCLDGDGETTIALDPSLPIAHQANRLYEKARRLDDGREITERMHAEARATEQSLAEVAAELAAAPAEALDALRARLQTLGALPKHKPEPKPGHKQPDRDVPFRRFTSAEGYSIFVGRNNAQNDELTMRFANGNDLWLHVGGGRPGSHVVVRLPRQKTASLETLLDAATLAVHFSKARGEQRIEVVYTFRKFVKKPKGLPAGAVVPSQTKTVTVLHDDTRLRRVLDSSADASD